MHEPNNRLTLAAVMARKGEQRHGAPDFDDHRGSKRRLVRAGHGEGRTIQF